MAETRLNVKLTIHGERLTRFFLGTIRVAERIAMMYDDAYEIEIIGDRSCLM